MGDEKRERIGRETEGENREGGRQRERIGREADRGRREG